MGRSLGWLGLVLCAGLCPVMGMQEGALRPVAASEGAPVLSCGHSSLQYTMPPTMPQDSNSTGSPLPVFIEDKAGLFHPLQNDSECGAWVSPQPDGSVVIGADFAGCYVREQDGEYTVTVSADSGFPYELPKTLKCPVPPVMDAPSPDVCSAVRPVNKLSCGRVPITQAVCEEHGCCYNSRDLSMPCYFGSPVTAHCTADGQATIAVSAAITVPPLILSSMRLVSVSSRCPGLIVQQNGGFQVYQFPLSCGRSYQQGDLTIYENQVEATQNILTWSGSSITRDTIFRLTVRCSFTSSSSFVPVQVEVFTLPPPPPVSSPGPLLLEMRIAKDPTYGSYYAASEYPVLKVLRDPVYLEVRVLQRTDPSLVLVLNQCWATSSRTPMQQPQWPILVDGCPFVGDNYRTQLIPRGAASSVLQFPSHYQQFIVSTFTFVDPSGKSLQGQVYFHCSASVCIPSALGSCTRSCPSRQRRMVEVMYMEQLTLVTAEVPIYFIDAGKKDDAEEDPVILQDSRTATPLSAMLPEWTIGTLVAVGFLAVALVCVGIWSYRLGQSDKAVAVNI